MNWLLTSQILLSFCGAALFSLGLSNFIGFRKQITPFLVLNVFYVYSLLAVMTSTALCWLADPFTQSWLVVSALTRNLEVCYALGIAMSFVSLSQKLRLSKNQENSALYDIQNRHN